MKFLAFFFIFLILPISPAIISSYLSKISISDSSPENSSFMGTWSSSMGSQIIYVVHSVRLIYTWIPLLICNINVYLNHLYSQVRSSIFAKLTKEAQKTFQLQTFGVFFHNELMRKLMQSRNYQDVYLLRRQIFILASLLDQEKFFILCFLNLFMWKIKKEEKKQFKDKNSRILPKLSKVNFHDEGKKKHQRSNTRPSENDLCYKTNDVNDPLLHKRMLLLLRESQFQNRRQRSLLKHNQISEFRKFENSQWLEQKQKKRNKNFTNRETLNIVNPLLSIIRRQSKLLPKPEQNMFQSYFQKKYQMKELQNYCYDSPFIIPREGPCLVKQHQSIYLIGGALRRKIGYTGKEQKNIDIPFHCYQDGQWVRERIIQEMPIHFRNIIWHTVDAVDEYLAIVGGMMGQSQRTMNSLNSDLLLYSPKNKKLQRFPINLPIRFHASTSFGNNLLIHGGEGMDGTFSKRLHHINLKDPRNPKILDITTEIDAVHHKLVNTLTLERSDQYSLGCRGGIFMFGGSNKKGQKLNKLLLLPTNYFEIDRITNSKFQHVDVMGSCPCPRAHHSFNLLPKKLALIIVGGLDSNENPLADVWLYNLFESTWAQVQMQPSLQLKFGGIHKHSSIAEGDQLLIYGGKHMYDQGIGNFVSLQLGKQMKKNKAAKLKENQKNISSFWSISLTNKQISDMMVEF